MCFTWWIYNSCPNSSSCTALSQLSAEMPSSACSLHLFIHYCTYFWQTIIDKQGASAAQCLECRSFCMATGLSSVPPGPVFHGQLCSLFPQLPCQYFPPVVLMLLFSVILVTAAIVTAFSLQTQILLAGQALTAGDCHQCHNPSYSPSSWPLAAPFGLR